MRVPLVVNNGNNLSLYVRLVKDCFSYRLNKVPFGKPLKVLAFDFKKVLVTFGSKVFTVFWEDCELLK